VVHVHVRLEQVRVRGIVVDDHLVDLREAVLVPLRQPLVVHPEPPVRVAVREPAIGGDHVDLVEVQNLEDRVEEVESVLARVALDALADVVQMGRELRLVVHAAP
jgi:hypothetical protein